MKSKERAGFTLIELMIVVAIIGILASLAIPTFRSFVLRSKTGEAAQNLGVMFKSASAYYATERANMGQTGALLRNCTVGDVGPLPASAKPQKQRLPPNTDFSAIGFNIAEYIYYSYGLHPETSAAACGGAANDATVYTLDAQGDLDGDTVSSTFELAVGSDADNVLFHARGMYVAQELE
jgi:type IV pilus assembly protein PilA